MKYLFTLLLAAMFSSAAFSQSEVKIGKQVWMTKNLDVDRFRNGEIIPEVTSKDQWEEYGRLKKPAWCYYDNNPENGKKYGKLYNWYAVIDSKGLAPVGYHIPSYAEWAKLEDYLGSDAGTKMKNKSGWSSYTTWNDQYISGNGTNTSGFSGLPGGYRNYIGKFNNIVEYGYWWSSSENNWYIASNWNLYYINGYVNRNDYSKQDGLSVRCIKD